MDKVEGKTLEIMQRSGGTWAAYENQDLGHYEAGRLAFLKVGEDATFKEAPASYPDGTLVGMGWRYRLVGNVDLKTGEIVRQSCPA